jgi:branched-chain amino acid aminotransferase
MDFSKLKGKIYFENRFIDNKRAKIHVLNHSLHFASAVFEGIRVYNKKILFLDDHLQRLMQSSKMMGLKINLSLKQLKKIHKQIIKINKIKNGYIRPLIYRSSHSMSPDTSKCKSLLCVATWKWPTLFASNLGIKLDLSKYPKLNNKIYPIAAKSSGSYQVSVISRIESTKKNFDDCLMLDLKKNIAETSACNIFWIKNNIVYTSKEHSILNGITRKAVIEICKIQKIQFKKGDYKIKNILKADCAFVTGTAAEIQSIKSIKNITFKKNNKIFNLLKESYESLKKNSPDKVLKIRKIL